MIIDKVYIVHYAPLENRRHFLTKMLEDNDITNYEFITDYDRNNTSKEVMDIYFKGNSLVPAQICITISHLEIYKKIINNNYNLVLILEDDAILNSNFKSNLNMYCENLPNDFEIGFLNDGCGYHANDIKKDIYWYPKNYTRTCCSYLITKGCCEKLVKSSIPFHEVIDFELNTQIKNQNLGCYWAEPTIVTDGSEHQYGQSYKRFNQL
jgi:GR25 family glycosyltransferase involved in LPS biosynthesis